MKEDIKYKIDSFDEESNYVGNSKLPKPPKPGEYIICQMCLKPILPNELSKDKKIRKRELKWHIHNRCYLEVDRRLDMATPRLMQDRYGKKDSMHNLVKKGKDNNGK